MPPTTNLVVHIKTNDGNKLHVPTRSRSFRVLPGIYDYSILADLRSGTSWNRLIHPGNSFSRFSRFSDILTRLN